MYVPSAILRKSVRASLRSQGWPSVTRCVHKFVAYTHADIFILIHHRAVRVAIVAAVVTVLDERPRFFLFLLLRVDELFDVRVPILQRIHLRRAPRFPPAFHYVCNLIVNFQERERSTWLATPA